MEKDLHRIAVSKILLRNMIRNENFFSPVYKLATLKQKSLTINDYQVF